MRFKLYTMLIVLSLYSLTGCIPMTVPDEMFEDEKLPGIENGQEATENSKSSTRVASWVFQDARGDHKVFGRGTFKYDNEGRLIAEKRKIYNGGGWVSAVVDYTFTYNDAGQRDSFTRKRQGYNEDGTASGSADTSSTGYSYDDSGTLTGYSSRIFYTTETVSFNYDGSGNLLSFGDASAPETSFVWREGNMARVDYDTDRYHVYSYDDKGQCIQLKAYSSYLTYLGYLKAVYSYNDDGQMIKRSFYDEAGHSSDMVFTWEEGSSNFNISDVQQYHLYNYGIFSGSGMPDY